MGEAEADIAFCLRADPGGIGQGHNTNFVTGWQQSQSGLRTHDTAATLAANMGSRTGHGVVAFDWQSGGTKARRNVGPQTSELTGSQTPAVFQNTGQGWWNQHPYATTIRTPEGSGSREANLVAHPLTASAGHHGHSSPRGDGSDNLVASSGERARALTASMHKGHDDDTDTMITTGGVRRLTPTECERLQGFPDGWTCTCGVQPYTTATCRCPDSPRYRGLGNAVTVNVAEWIGRRIAEAHRCDGR